MFLAPPPPLIIVCTGDFFVAPNHNSRGDLVLVRELSSLSSLCDHLDKLP